MKNLILFLMVLLSGHLLAQDNMLQVDESLVVSIMDVSGKGKITAAVLDKATQLDINDPKAKIVSFVFSWPDEQAKKVTEMKVDGAVFSEKMRMQLKIMKTGDKFYIDSIIVEKEGKEVMVNPLILTITS